MGREAADGDATRWLVYREPSRGQGMGSTMHGISAALHIASQNGHPEVVVRLLYRVARDWLRGGGLELVDFSHLVMRFEVLRVE